MGNKIEKEESQGSLKSAAIPKGRVILLNYTPQLK